MYKYSDSFEAHINFEREKAEACAKEISYKLHKSLVSVAYSQIL